jgi:hypothetical protein
MSYGLNVSHNEIALLEMATTDDASSHPGANGSAPTLTEGASPARYGPSFQLRRGRPSARAAIRRGTGLSEKTETAKEALDKLMLQTAEREQYHDQIGASVEALKKG